MNNFAANATRATNLYLRAAVESARAADGARGSNGVGDSTSVNSATECRVSLTTAASEASTASERSTGGNTLMAGEVTSDGAGELSVRARQSLFSQALLASRSRR